MEDHTKEGESGIENKRGAGKDQTGEETGWPGRVGRSGRPPWGGESSGAETRREAKRQRQSGRQKEGRGDLVSVSAAGVAGQERRPAWGPSKGASGPGGVGRGGLATQVWPRAHSPPWMNPGPQRGSLHIWHLQRAWWGPVEDNRLQVKRPEKP